MTDAPIIPQSLIPNSVSTDSLLATEFRSVDGQSSEAQERCVRCLQFIRSNAQFQAAREVARRRLCLDNSVSSILDLGCGLGDDCIQFAEDLSKHHTNMTYHVYGVDASKLFLDFAAQRMLERPSTRNNVRLIHSAAQDLLTCRDIVAFSELEAGALDRIYEERTLQHITRLDCGSIVHQILCLLKPGGIFVAVEPHWELFSLFPGDLRTSRRLRDYWADSFNHGEIVLSLPTMMRRAGFHSVRTELIPVMFDRFADADLVYDLTRTIHTLSEKALITEKERDRWLEEQQLAGDDYSCLLQMAIISGIKL